MSRIVAFGCSHTYGLELPDCLTINDPPSKMSFSSIIGKRLGFEVLNRSDTGASQRQISATVLDTEFYNDDIVIIHWTCPSRRGIWNGIHWDQLAGWNKDKIWQRYYAKYHYNEDDKLESLMNINLANLFLKEKCKKVINTIHDYNNDIINPKLPWNSVKMQLVFNDKKFYYKTHKGGHPDSKSHEVFAERLMNII